MQEGISCVVQWWHTHTHTLSLSLSLSLSRVQDGQTGGEMAHEVARLSLAQGSAAVQVTELALQVLQLATIAVPNPVVIDPCPSVVSV